MSQPESDRGMSIFLDVFRRADKNDDNCISREEFESFFSDGILKKEELEELFSKIDTHNSNNIDTGELCTYFSSHLGPFQTIFGALEDLSHGVSEALQQTAQEYSKKSFYDQFTLRFLMKEVAAQLSAVEQSMDSAANHLEEDALKDRERQTVKVEVTGPPTTSNAGWIQRRARRQLSTQTSMTAAGLNGLTEQVDRLQALITELESKVKLDPVDEETVSQEEDELATLVSRQLTVGEESKTSFHEQLKTYIEAGCKESGCINICVRSVKEGNTYTLYEVWESPNQAESHLMSASLQAFKDKTEAMLTKPEERHSLNVPSKWICGSDS